MCVPLGLHRWPALRSAMSQDRRSRVVAIWTSLPPTLFPPEPVLAPQRDVSIINHPLSSSSASTAPPGLRAEAQPGSAPWLGPTHRSAPIADFLHVKSRNAGFSPGYSWGGNEGFALLSLISTAFALGAAVCVLLAISQQHTGSRCA